MLEFYKEVEAEKDTKCGDNQDCRTEFNYTMVEKGPKYSALNNFLEGQTWVTSINPAEETIKVLIFDDDMMFRHIGIEEKLTFEHFYVGWFENWQNQIYNYDHERFTNGSVAGVHTVYDSYTDDINNLVPWQEVELRAEGSNLVDNISGKLGYAAYADRFNAVGAIDYSNCLTASDYSYGTECNMMISGDQWISYFPPREQINESDENQSGPTNSSSDSQLEPTHQDEQTNEPDNDQSGLIDQDEQTLEPNDDQQEPTNQEEVIAESNGNQPEQQTQDKQEIEAKVSISSVNEPNFDSNEDPNTNPTEAIATNSTTDSDLNSNENIVVGLADNTNSDTSKLRIASNATPSIAPNTTSNTTSNITPEAPETGQATKSREASAEMPWWIIILSILSISLILRWLAPSQSTKNVTKTHKKVLTKKGNCDKMVSV